MLSISPETYFDKYLAIKYFRSTNLNLWDNETSRTGLAGQVGQEGQVGILGVYSR